MKLTGITTSCNWLYWELAGNIKWDDIRDVAGLEKQENRNIQRRFGRRRGERREEDRNKIKRMNSVER